MGSGIAQAAAQAGFYTLLYELNPLVLEQAINVIEKNLQSLTEKGKITTKEKQQISQRIQFTGDIQTCLADVFIEAIVEKTEIKISIPLMLKFMLLGLQYIIGFSTSSAYLSVSKTSLVLLKSTSIIEVEPNITSGCEMVTE